MEKIFSANSTRKIQMENSNSNTYNNSIFIYYHYYRKTIKRLIDIRSNNYLIKINYEYQ